MKSMRIEANLEALGLPEPVKPPPGIELSFAWIRVRGDRAYAPAPNPSTLTTRSQERSAR
jgi:hypothetical protein